MTRAVATCLVLASLSLVAIPAAAATEIDPQRLTDLAARAESDPAALDELRGVTSIGDEPVDMAAILDAPPASVAARLKSIAEMGDTAAAAPASELAETARSILAGSEYDRGEGVRGESLSARLADLINRYFPEPIARLLTSTTLWIIAGLVALGLVLAFAFRTSRRRAYEFSVDSKNGSADFEGLSADEMELAADAAEASGRLDEAVRLRFRAGLLRLGDVGAIRYSDSISTAAVSSRIGSTDFDTVAGTFDRVHYGKIGADQGDVDEARERWPRVLASVRGSYG